MEARPDVRMTASSWEKDSGNVQEHETQHPRTLGDGVVADQEEMNDCRGRSRGALQRRARFS
jgi:hypothetical protein